MFSAINHTDGLKLPLFETRKALIILNLQNDSFYVKDDLYVTKNRDFVPRLKEMIPYFREHGDVVWVCTQMGVLPSEPSPDAAKIEAEASKLAEKNRKEQVQREQQMEDDTQQEAKDGSTRGLDQDLSSFYPSSRLQKIMTRPSAGIRADKRSADLQTWKGEDNVLAEHLSKPRKGPQARFYIGGTKGAEICDDLIESVDHEKDLIVTKYHYSAFDQTSLLLALRTKLVTEIYLCGCLTNVGIYSTAADAVQHGLQVTLVEDCLGYRSEDKHEEAMRQMSDIMGVSGIDSEEIIEESGLRPPPDSVAPGITLEELSLNAKVIHQESIGAAVPHDKKYDSKENFSISPVVAQIDDGTEQTLERKGSAAKRDSLPTPRNRSSWNMAKLRTLGPEDEIGSGDSRIIYSALSSSLIELAFQQLKDEVDWQTMLHRSGQVPRLVAVQGAVGKHGEVPLYRHPADESPPLLPFTETVQRIREEAEAQLGQSFNHALIQLYRDGIDNISEHADKVCYLDRIYWQAC